MIILLIALTQDLTADNNAFAADLHARLREREGNLFYSPYSVSTALAMTYAGARGVTADEMAAAMHFKSDKLHEAFAAQIKGFNGEHKGYTLTVANALWGQSGIKFEKDFTELLNRTYGAGFNEVDYQTDTEGSRKTINAWVEKETREKIKDLLKPGVLTIDTKLVLTNAIYFKGDWAAKFDPKATAAAPFHLTADTTADIPTMVREDVFQYAATDDLQILSMPYVGRELSMVVLLPKKELAALEEGFTVDALNGWTKRLRDETVHVHLPKFKLTCDLTLNSDLQALGMKSAFSDGADFSGITRPSSLFISAVVHKAFVDVNEEGTEAAAATGVVMGDEGMHEQIHFRADRPFLFLIRHEKSGAILFIGRVADPRG